MVRTFFLLLVVVGALTVVFAVVLGVGVLRLSADVSAADANAAATAPPQPVIAPAAAAPAIAPPAAPAMAVLAPPPISPASPPPEPLVPAGTIVLKPGDAALKGDQLRLTPTGDLRFGTRKGASVVWQISDVPAGDYHVELTYSAEEDGGGEITVQVSQDGGDSFTVDIEPTGDAEKFRTVREGPLSFSGKKKSGLIIRSRRARDEDLMNLREVRLVPLEAAAPAAGRRRGGG